MNTGSAKVNIEPRPQGWRMAQHMAFEMDALIGKHPNFGQRFKPDVSQQQKIKYDQGQDVLNSILKEGSGWYQNIGISQYAPVTGYVDMLWTNGRIYNRYPASDYNWGVSGGIVAFRPSVDQGKLPTINAKR